MKRSFKEVHQAVELGLVAALSTTYLFRACAAGLAIGLLVGCAVSVTAIRGRW